MSSNTKFDELLRDANAAFDALSPEEQRAHRREQRISWVRGEMMIEHPEMTYEYATVLAERAIAKVASEDG